MVYPLPEPEPEPEAKLYTVVVELEEDVVFSVQQYAEGTVIILEAIEKEGYVFEGYALEYDGAVIFTAGDALLVDRDIVLYAVYTRIELPTDASAPEVVPECI